MTIDSMVIDVARDAGALLKLLGEPLRWEIAAQPLVSHHLGVLRQAGVVRSEKVGAFTYYVLEREVVAQLADVLGELAADPAERRRRPCS